MSTETVIITGSNLNVDHQADAVPNEPLRRRPPEYVPTVATGVDLLELISLSAHTNPYWTPEANAAADGSNEQPKRLAKRWRKHRIEKAA